MSLDWRLHAPMVFKILMDLEYLKNRGVSFHLRKVDSVILRRGGYGYSPNEIRSFEDALSVLRDNGAACTPHFDAICLLEGVMYYRILDKGRALLKRIGC
jgi:hypothetical protein